MDARNARLGGRLAWASDVADRLWPAWRSLERWEDAVEDEMGTRLGDVLLLLWAVHRFSGLDDADVILDAVLEAEPGRQSPDPFLQDVVQLAFALGASWAVSRGDAVRHEPEGWAVPRLHAFALVEES